MKNNTIEELAKNVRIDVLKMINKAHSSHIGSAFSVVDILSVLYFNIIDKKNDKVILSKGHAGSALYATLAECGYFDKEMLNDYCMNGSCFSGHISSKNIPGVEFATGSLGHGLPVACGIAYTKKLKELEGKIYVILGDGECQEGTTWESLLFASQHHLDNLIIVIDKNNMQAFGNVNEILSLNDLSNKFKAFNCCVKEVDGHNFNELNNAFKDVSNEMPNCIIANTIKGKGVSYMENKLEWHYRTPTNELFDKAMEELDK